ncbi:Crp/Fnr family transcriptional regulator [Psychromonas aquimarina]|uniref:Crp/Fnr family transcriptional regulator n=1 Tax=Psychromonas aquimarina TaxID=444919 RepID=UPI0004168613|nr:Crp/Fnr family transcriptional regulator [Psychromonas aquimarina]
MTDSSTDAINWPCPLSNTLKRQLLDIAQCGKGLPNTQKKAAFPGLYYITSGLATLSFLSENMNNTLGFVLGVNDWVGANSLGNSADLFFLTVELEPVEYLFLSKQKIAQLAENNNEVFKFLYYCMIQMQPRSQQAPLTALHDKEIRIVYTLLALAQKKQTLKGVKTTIDITQEQLCTVTGLSRPRINEVLKNIEKAQEISIERGKIHIIDINALGERLNQLNSMFSDPRIKP